MEMGPGSLLRDAGVPRGIFMAGAGSVAVCVEPCRGRSRSWPGADDALSSLLFRSSCSMSGAFLAPGDAVVGTGIPHSVELPLGSAVRLPQGATGPLAPSLSGVTVKETHSTLCISQACLTAECPLAFFHLSPPLPHSPTPSTRCEKCWLHPHTCWAGEEGAACLGSDMRGPLCVSDGRGRWCGVC